MLGCSKARHVYAIQSNLAWQKCSRTSLSECQNRQSVEFYVQAGDPVRSGPTTTFLFSYHPLVIRNRDAEDRRVETHNVACWNIYFFLVFQVHSLAFTSSSTAYQTSISPPTYSTPVRLNVFQRGMTLDICTATLSLGFVCSSLYRKGKSTKVIMALWSSTR